MEDFPLGCGRVQEFCVHDEVWCSYTPYGYALPSWPQILPGVEGLAISCGFREYISLRQRRLLGPFPGHTRFCPVTGKPLVFYPSFVVPKTKPGSYRWVLNASYNRGGPSVNDLIADFSTSLIDVKSSLYPCLRTRFMSRIDLKRAFKQLHRAVSQMYLLATMVGEFVFIDATMSMGLRNTCKLFKEDFRQGARAPWPILIFGWPGIINW